MPFCGPDLTQNAVQLDSKELMALSFCDIRRIAALRSKDRLRQILQRQAVVIPKGQWKLSEPQQCSLVPTLSPAHLTSLHAIWDQVVKYVDITGAQMLDYLQQHCEAATAGQELREQRRCHRRPSFGPVVDAQRRCREGRVLVFHITDIVANLRQRGALREMVGRKLDLLLEMGYTTSNIQSISASVVNYLQQTYPKYWCRAAEQACNIVLKCLRGVANEHLARRLPPHQLFRDPVTNIAYNPKLST